MAKPKIFISYKRNDKEIARSIIERLQALNIQVFIDDSIVVVSESIADKIRDRIKKSDICVWIISKESLKSSWCPVEVGAFWGDRKPIIIYNPHRINIDGPLRDIKPAFTVDEVIQGIKGIRIGPRNNLFGELTVKEARKIIGDSIMGLSEEIEKFHSSFPGIIGLLGKQNTFLEDQNNLLLKVTEILEERKPRKVHCAFDVPSFGSLSAERIYPKCCEAFDQFTKSKDWELKIVLLPADVGTKIVDNEFTDLKKQIRAWENDIQALERFRGYKRQAVQAGQRNFSINWIEVNRDCDGRPVGVHNMPLNVWIFDDEEAVFSTVINSYHPPESMDIDSNPHEIGFSTRDHQMVRFLKEILAKYQKNIDSTISLRNQIIASKAERDRLKELV